MRILAALVVLMLLAAPVLAQTPTPFPPGLPDRDGDGIPDEFDLCPDLFAEGGGVDGTGCPMGPDFDTDGDGVPDSEDLCPTIYAEDGGVDGTGCPPEVFAEAVDPAAVEQPAPDDSATHQGGAYLYPFAPPPLPHRRVALPSPEHYGPYYRGLPPCAGSLPTRLVTGEPGRIAERFSTLRYYPAGPAIRVVYAPATFDVIAGPVCAGYGPLAWYYIRYRDGRGEGWASESQRYSSYGYNRYWLLPLAR